MFGPSSTTVDIYDSLVKPLVPWAWSGGIGTMFAYGQTASGKTLTVTGIEKLVAETLMDGSLEGERKISISIIELAGQTAYGETTMETVWCRALTALRTSSTPATRSPSLRTLLGQPRWQVPWNTRSPPRTLSSDTLKPPPPSAALPQR